MVIPYQITKFKFNIFAMVIWGPTTKFNSRQYFQLYGMQDNHVCSRYADSVHTEIAKKYS